TPWADVHEVAARLGKGDRPAGQSITPSQEIWQVYVPPDYDPDSGYGVLVWISPSDSGAIPYGWEYALRDHKLIYVAAYKSGNDQDVVTRRVPLALTALASIEAGYKIDPNRVYVGGFSGGGVTASHMAAGYADLFTGGLFVSVSHGIGTPSMPVPALPLYADMKSRGRYVFTAGTEEAEYQIATTRAVDAFHALCVLRTEYIHIPNAVHANLEPRIFSRALTFLDEPKTPGAEEQADCAKSLEARRATALGAIRQAMGGSDKAKAWELLRDADTAFGPLVQPELSRYSACLDGSIPSDCPAPGP
ncbi:MAG: hypothetical protein ACM3ZT_12195, partial [Bacillota bacterium]